MSIDSCTILYGIRLTAERALALEAAGYLHIEDYENPSDAERDEKLEVIHEDDRITRAQLIESLGDYFEKPTYNGETASRIRSSISCDNLLTCEPPWQLQLMDYQHENIFYFGVCTDTLYFGSEYDELPQMAVALHSEVREMVKTAFQKAFGNSTFQKEFGVVSPKFYVISHGCG